MMKKSLARASLFGVVIFLLMGIRIGYADPSNDIYVDTFTDELTTNGSCSLREAIHSANGNPMPDCVGGDPGAGAHIYLQEGSYYLEIPGQGEDLNATGDLDLGRSMYIHGADRAATIIHGGNIDRVMEVINGASATISDVTIRNGDLDPGSDGGAGVMVRNGASLNMNSCRVTNNNAPGSFGGGINNYFGTVVIQDSSIDDNSGAEGGGIFNGGQLEIYRSLIQGNTANDQGGGLKNAYPLGIASLENVTISGNNSNTGSGIFSNDDIILTNVTVVRNIGVGSGFANLGMANLTNTIVAHHVLQTNCTGDAENFNSGGYNIEDNPIDFNSCHLDVTGDQVDTDPMLVGVVPIENGGPTKTFALDDGSPAIDNGNPSDCPGTDQRGFPRPVDGDQDGTPVCDIGAFESDLKFYFPIVFKNE